MTGRSTDPVMRDITKMHESEEAADTRWAEEKERLPDVFNDALQRIRDDRQAVENLGGDYLPHPDLSFRNYQSMLHGLSQCYWLTAGGFDVLIAAARGYVDDEVDSIEDALPVITMSGYTPPEPGCSADEPQAPSLHKPFRPREVLAVLDRVLAS